MQELVGAIKHAAARDGTQTVLPVSVAARGQWVLTCWVHLGLVPALRHLAALNVVRELVVLVMNLGQPPIMDCISANPAALGAPSKCRALGGALRAVRGLLLRTVEAGIAHFVRLAGTNDSWGRQ